MDSSVADQQPGAGRAGHYAQPLSGLIVSVVLALASIAVISAFLTQRWLAVKVWTRLPYVVWLVFAIYIDSFLFVFATAIVQYGLGVDSSFPVCESAILLCLVCYISSKILIYMFLVEKAYIIRGTTKRRMRSKLYLFNSFGMLGVYCCVAALNFVFRITRMQQGLCIIGMEKFAVIPLIGFDVLVNVYLTILFLLPLSGLYSFKKTTRSSATLRLRTVALRTFIGAVCTLVSSVVNLTVLMALNGEPGWVCLMCCNSDILFSAMVIQWITSSDTAGSGENSKTGSHVLSNRHHCGEEAGTGVGIRSLNGDLHTDSRAHLDKIVATDNRNSAARSSNAGLDGIADLRVHRAGSAASNSMISADSVAVEKSIATSNVKEQKQQVRFPDEP